MSISKIGEINKKERNPKECSLCFGAGLCNCSTTGFNLPDNVDTCPRCEGSGYEPIINSKKENENNKRNK